MKLSIKWNSNCKIGDTEFEKQKFHQYKRPVPIKNIDIDEIVVSNRVFFGKKRI